MKDLGNDVIVHLDRAEHRLVIIDLEEDLIVRVDWATLRLILIDLGKDTMSSRRLRKTSSGHDRPGGQRRSLRGPRIKSPDHN